MLKTDKARSDVKVLRTMDQMLRESFSKQKTPLTKRMWLTRKGCDIGKTRCFSDFTITVEYGDKLNG